MEKLLLELFKALIPDVLNPAKHTVLSFICSMFGIIIYGNLMLNDDDVDDWKQGLLWTVVWMLVSALAVFLATGEFTKIEAGQAYSKFFISGMLLLSIAYVVISISAWWVRDGCSARVLSVLVVIGRAVDSYWFASLVIQ